MVWTSADYQQFLYRYVTFGIGILAVFFNILEIIFMKYFKSFKKNPIGMVYILNMAISDIIVGFTMVILKSMDPYMKTTLANNETAHEIYHVIRFCFIRFSLLLSVFNLIALTIDRVCAIRFPFSINRKNIYFHYKVCSGVWISSFLITIIFYCLARYYLKDNERYKDFIFPIATFPATGLFVVSYAIIFNVVRRSSNTIATTQNSVRNNQQQNNNTPSSPNEKVK